MLVTMRYSAPLLAASWGGTMPTSVRAQIKVSGNCSRRPAEPFALSAAAWLLARAQQPERMRRIGVLTGGGHLKESDMANVYVEARPKGRSEGSPIEDYVVEDHADHVLDTFKTQREAIEWARKQGHHPHVARVRHLNDKKKADHWRAA